MMLWGVFEFFENNKTARWVLGIVTGVALYKLYERLRDNRIRKRAEEKVMKQIDKENTRVEEAVDQADRDAVERLNAEQLRKLTESDPLNRGRAPRD